MQIQGIPEGYSALASGPTADQWKRIGIRPHHGFNLPLFSLRSVSSCGIGEYSDLLPMIDWCAQLGWDVIQLLPLNDTGPDASPYSAISAFALNPIHLGLEGLPNIDRYPSLGRIIQELKLLNASQRVQYPRVRELKEELLEQYYSTEFPLVANTEDYQAFLKNNRWLRGFALFKTLKKQHHWQAFAEWPEELRNPSSETLKELEQHYLDEVQYHQFIQYLCSQQLKAAKDRASLLGVHLKGDIPILISRESADLWEHPNLFKAEFAAGAPPDMYSEEGQKWGFPLFNWEVMALDNYQWWYDRLEVASHYYHLYRLDHVVGFFRIWAIPLDKPAKQGHFLPSDEASWMAAGRQILHMMIAGSSMLPIGEDLGNIPDGVRPCLRELGICGTKVMRWERRWKQHSEFIPINDYLLESMTTVSTHDSETLGQWWTNVPQEAQVYAAFMGWDYTSELSKERRIEVLRDSHHSNSLFHINLLQEYLALFPDLVWPNPEDERINVPGTISDNNWSYRFRPTVEQIIGNEALAQAMQLLVS